MAPRRCTMVMRGRSDIVTGFVDAVMSDFPAATSVGWADQLDRLASLTHFHSGDVLIGHHAVADDLHFLVDGTVRYEHLVTDVTETISHDEAPLMPIGWSALHYRRYQATVVAEEHGTLLTLPLEKWDELAATSPSLHAYICDFVLRTASGLLSEARGTDRRAITEEVDTSLMQPASNDDAGIHEPLSQSPVFGSLQPGCRDWLAEHSKLYELEIGDRFLCEGDDGGGLWLLVSGRVSLRFDAVRDNDVQSAVRYATRPGTLLCLSLANARLPAPYEVEATRSATVAHVPRSALAELLQHRPGEYAAIVERQLRKLRSNLLSTRAHFANTPDDGGVDTLRKLIADRMPLLPADTALIGLPEMFTSKLTRRHAFDVLYLTHRHGTEGEREGAGLAIDLFQDFERGHRFTSGLRTAYDGVVRNSHLDARQLRKISTRLYRDALSHVPYVISGMRNLPDDANCVFIFNHMAYADESILPNGFLYNPDSHLLSSIIVEPRYGDSIRIARTNATTEFWRADYYEPLGHIGVVTPESGWIDETPEERRARKARFWIDCERALASGQPLCIAPEGTITEENSVTERSPGPFRPGAFLLSGRLPSHPRIVPVAMANFDKPAHTAVFSCVIKPSFTMEERGIDVDDREALGQFLVDYRKEFRGHVEEAIGLARNIRDPHADRTSLVTNIDDIGPARYEYEHDVRALEMRTADQPTGTAPTVFYGSSTIVNWKSLVVDVGIQDAVALGFGGATLTMAQDYFQRLVVDHAPARLVVYFGENDIARGATAATASAAFIDFAETVRIWLPGTFCWFVSMKAGPALYDRRDEIDAGNARIATEIETLEGWELLDWAPHLLGDDGRANEDLFAQDGIHVNQFGYDILARLLRGALAKAG